MKDDGFSPMIDAGSSRVFDCNGITLKLLAESRGGGELFFRHPRLNHVVVIKHSVLPSERRSRRDPPVGTKLYFPFNERDPAEGGSTIFLHDRQLEAALDESCGAQPARRQEAFDEDLRLLAAPGAAADARSVPAARRARGRERSRSTTAISTSATSTGPRSRASSSSASCRSCSAAYPEAKASRAKAKRLIEKLWEADDEEALAPIIQTFGLPEDGALEHPLLVEGDHLLCLSVSAPAPDPPRVRAVAQGRRGDRELRRGAAARTRWRRLHRAVRNELRTQWQQASKRSSPTTRTATTRCSCARPRPGRSSPSCATAAPPSGRSATRSASSTTRCVCWDRITRRYPRAASTRSTR